MPLSCRLGHKQTSTPQGLPIAVATLIYGTSSKSWVQGDAPRIPISQTPPYTPVMHHFPWLFDIKTTFLQPVLHNISPPRPEPTHWATTRTLPYIELLSNPVIFHSLHINPIVHPFRHPTQLHYLCIPDFIHSFFIHLYSPNHRPLLLSPYHCLTTIRKNRHQQWLMQDNSTLKLQTPSINQRPNTTATLLPLVTFLRHSTWSVPD